MDVDYQVRLIKLFIGFADNGEYKKDAVSLDVVRFAVKRSPELVDSVAFLFFDCANHIGPVDINPVERLFPGEVLKLKGAPYQYRAVISFIVADGITLF